MKLTICAVLLAFFSISAVVEAETYPYVNHDLGWVRDPYAGPVGGKAEFESVADALSIVKSASEFQGEAVGFAHRRSEVYGAHEYLAENAGKEVLLELLRHKNPVARCYSILALEGRLDTSDVDRHAEALLLDTELFATLHYDMMSESTVSDCMIQSWHFAMSDRMRGEVADHLLREMPETLSTHQMLFYWPLDEKHYPLVREIFENGMEVSIVALAGFQRESDISIIEEATADNRFLAMSAIARFPHERFLPLVRTALDEEIRERAFLSPLEYVFAALLAYPDELALEILTPYLDGQEGEIEDLAEKASTLFRVLEGAGSGRHMALKMNLFREWQGITPDSLQELLAHDSGTVADIAVAILTAPPQDGENLSFDLDIVYVFDELLAIVEQHRRDALPQVLINTAARSDINTFPSVARMLIEHRPEEADRVLSYLIREVRQASYLARAVGALEAIDPSQATVALLEQNVYLREPWENWEGNNCHRMIDHHVASEGLRERLKRQCREEIEQ